MIDISLNLKEKKKMQSFINRHKRTCPKIINEHILRFSAGSGIGVSTLVVCPTCEVSKDITDYGAW